jgi:hypothetical protein
VNGNAASPQELKEVMQREQLNWRSFGDDGAIQTRWNAGTPSYYVLDPQGVIRHKWVGYPGESAINTALERLIHQAEASSP